MNELCLDVNEMQNQRRAEFDRLRGLVRALVLCRRYKEAAVYSEQLIARFPRTQAAAELKARLGRLNGAAPVYGVRDLDFSIWGRFPWVRKAASMVTKITLCEIALTVVVSVVLGVISGNPTSPQPQPVATLSVNNLDSKLDEIKAIQAKISEKIETTQVPNALPMYEAETHSKQIEAPDGLSARNTTEPEPARIRKPAPIPSATYDLPGPDSEPAPTPIVAEVGRRTPGYTGYNVPPDSPTNYNVAPRPTPTPAPKPIAQKPKQAARPLFKPRYVVDSSVPYPLSVYTFMDKPKKT